MRDGKPQIRVSLERVAFKGIAPSPHCGHCHRWWRRWVPDCRVARLPHSFFALDSRHVAHLETKEGENQLLGCGVCLPRWSLASQRSFDKVKSGGSRQFKHNVFFFFSALLLLLVFLRILLTAARDLSILCVTAAAACGEISPSVRRSRSRPALRRTSRIRVW